MTFEIEVVEIAPTVMASVRQRVAWAELSRWVPSLLGEVWDFLKTAPVAKAGHNVAVYHDPTAKDVEVECGVQVAGTVTASGRIRRAETPSGRAAHIVYLGPYGGLGKAHDAMPAFCREHGYTKGVHWEVYGDWSEDPASLRTDVYALIGKVAP